MPLNIPVAPGVPGHEAQGSQAPQWWDNTATAPRTYDVELDADDTPKDPRWNGSTRREYDSGAAVVGIFRAVHMMEPPVGGGANLPVLYLSFQVLRDASASYVTDGVFFGFQGASGVPHIFEVDGYINLNSGPQTPPRFVLYGAEPDGLHYHVQTWTGSAKPKWLETARAWVTVQGSAPNQVYTWVINVRVPMIATGDLADNGINLTGANFKFFYAIVKDTGAGAVPYMWPRLAAAPFKDTSYPGQLMKFPAVSAWDTAQIGGTGPGIALKKSDIGTGNPDPSQISFSAAHDTLNTLHADVTNHTGVTIPARTLRARFRIANWGSQPWEDYLTGAAWQEIRPTDINVNGSDIPDNSSALDRRINCPWTVTVAEAAPWINGTNDDHQCILATLSGYRDPPAAGQPPLPTVSYDFINDSAFANMRFVAVASAFTERAEISIAQAPQGKGGGLLGKVPILRNLPILRPPTDVFMFVSTSNMPATVPAKKPMPPRDVSALMETEQPFEIRAARLPYLKRNDDDGPITIDDLASVLTTIRYFVYRSTGRKIHIGGKDRPLLQEQTAFGYFVQHKQPIFGWDHQLGGSFSKVAPNMYKLSVPAGGSKLIQTTVMGYTAAPPKTRLKEIVAGPPGKIQRSIPIVKNLPPVENLLARVTGIFRR